MSFVEKSWGVHCVGRHVGLAPRTVPSVEQANSAIFCSRVSHILHHVHTRRLAHAQMDSQHQQRAASPLEALFLELRAGGAGSKWSGGLSGPRCTLQMGREPRSVWAVYADAVAQYRKLRSFRVAGKGLSQQLQTAGREGKVERRQRDVRRKGKKWGEN